MSDSHVIARKFRPQSFDQVVGQEAITRTLMNSIKSGRLHHAYLFTGSRGVGKTTTARILAKALNCVKGITSEPCDACPSCLDITASRSIDVQEIDAATYTKVEDTREVIINSIAISPARDRHKIFIIDEVHQLSSHSFNALLKTIEEPPPRVVFILATTDQGKVPETILSRCQIFEFRTITLKKIVEQLRYIAGKEGVQIGDAALLAIARAGEGSMRDAESALDQVISFSGSTVGDDDVSAALGLVDIETLNSTLQAIADQDSRELVRIVEQVVSRGYDLRNFCREMMVHIRALLVVKITGFDTELVQLPESEAEALNQLAAFFSEQDLLRFFSILTKTEQDIKNSAQPRFQLEVGLVKLAQARKLFLLEDAIHRIEALESRVGGGSAAPSSTGGRTGSASRDSRPSQVQSRPPSTSTRAASLTRPPENQSSQARSTEEAAVKPAKASASTSPVIAAVAQPQRPAEKPDAAKQTPSPLDKTTESTIGATRDRGSSASDPIDKIKRALEAKRKMMIVTALDKGSITIDADYFRVTYEPGNSQCKGEIEARDKRIAIEDACEEVLGHRLTLWASVAGEPEVAQPRRKEKAREAAVSDPKLRALVDKFHGEVIEVIKPEQ
ncbi:MAG TPA: DNA polymerase III subunit gamma/tau [Blastocatellia bacterium]|nr:DNA polymerase III subunit gamma/tau [Blastocatellia bacterium]